MGKRIISICVMSFILSFMFGNLYAQTYDLQYISTNKKQFGFNYDRPFYANNLKLSALSGVYQFYLDIPISSKLNIIGNLPYISTSYDIDYGFIKYSYSQSGIGNIFIGLQTNQTSVQNNKNILTFGIYLPTASEKASYNGLTADYYYMSKYLPNSIGIYFNYAFHKIRSEGFKYGLEIGPNVVIPTQDNGSSTELLAHFGIIAGYQINQIEFNIEFAGIAVISEDIEPFGDRFVNMLNFGACWNGSKFAPMIYYKIFLRKEIRQTVNGVLGVGINFSIE